MKRENTLLFGIRDLDYAFSFLYTSRTALRSTLGTYMLQRTTSRLLYVSRYTYSSQYGTAVKKRISNLPLKEFACDLGPDS